MNCMLALNREIWDGELCSLKALVNRVARGGKGINFKHIRSANAGTCFQPPCPNKQRAPTIQSSLEVWHLKSIYFDCRKVRIITVSVHLRLRKSCPEHRRHATDPVQSNVRYLVCIGYVSCGNTSKPTHSNNFGNTQVTPSSYVETSTSNHRRVKPSPTSFSCSL